MVLYIWFKYVCVWAYRDMDVHIVELNCNCMHGSP